MEETVKKHEFIYVSCRDLMEREFNCTYSIGVLKLEYAVFAYGQNGMFVS